MRCSSISIGVENYVNPYYRNNGMRLQYSVSDAKAFFQYAKHAFSENETQPNHEFLSDEQVNHENITAAFERINNRVDLDLFLLYLSGHGECDDNSKGWFCLVDARPRVASLDGRFLESLLEKIKAKKIIVFIDCCHAESIFSGARFFSQLGSTHSRLLIASARAHQRAWEDASLLRSVFSDVLLRALSSSSPIQDGNGEIDVEAALIPYLRDQVMLLSAKNKNGITQEPVSGGYAISPLKLRVANSKTFGRALTLAETLRNRIRQIVIKSFVAMLLICAAIHVMTFHLTLSTTGEIIVKQGLYAFTGLLPPFLINQVDTGLTLADVNMKNREFLTQLSNGGLWGFSTHRDANGLRSWLSTLEPALKKEAKSSYTAFTLGKILELDPTENRAPIGENLFLHQRILHQDLSKINSMYPYTIHAAPDCDKNPAQVIDFGAINPSVTVSMDDYIWTALTISPKTYDENIKNLVQLAAYRATSLKNPENAIRELNRIALAAYISKSSVQIENQTSLITELNSKLETRCGIHAAVVLGAISSPKDSAYAESSLLKNLLTYDRSQTGDIGTLEQELASAGLVILSKIRPLGPTTLIEITKMVKENLKVLGSENFLNKLLNGIADNQILPDEIVELLFAKSHLTDERNDFESLAAARLLARNARYLTDKQVRKILELTAKLGPTNKTSSYFHQTIGFISLASRIDNDSIGMLVSNLSPNTFFPTNKTTFRGETAIFINGDDAAIALGRVAQSIRLKEEIIERLARLAITRRDLEDRKEIIKGLSYQWYDSEKNISETIYSRLSSTRSNSDIRSLEVEAACQRIVKSKKETQPIITQQLLKYWELESEPEIRLGLAQLIGRIRFLGFGESNFCELQSQFSM